MSPFATNIVPFAESPWTTGNQFPSIDTLAIIAKMFYFTASKIASNQNQYMNKSKYLYESPAVTTVEVKAEGVICVSPTAERRSYGVANSGVTEELDGDGNWNWD